MKYRCKICGSEKEAGASPPTTECECCGAVGEWEANPFDARCTKCGQGYYESEKPNFCPNCGNRIAAPAPAVTIRRARKRPTRATSPSPAATGGSTPRAASPATPSPAPTDLSWVKFSFKVLAWIVGIVLACWLGYYAVIWLWAVLCFIARHWIISLIVLFFIIGAAAKS